MTSGSADREKSIVIQFFNGVQFNDLKIFTRQICCRNRYNQVSLYADGELIARTPKNLDDPGQFISFKKFLLSSTYRKYAKNYKITWPPTKVCAQVEELFFNYIGLLKKSYGH